jgi:hypothetical protein
VVDLGKQEEQLKKRLKQNTIDRHKRNIKKNKEHL